MIGRDPKLDGGILQRGMIYRFRVPRVPAREPSAEVLEVVRRAERKLVRQYLERRKRAT